MIIKALLIAAFMLLAVYAARGDGGGRQLAVRRLATISMLFVAGIAVIFPDLVTRAAQAVGVGRGTDLVLYVFVVVSALLWLGIHRRLRELDAKLTQVARAQALGTARGHADSPFDVD